MKKTYIEPATELEIIQQEAMIALSGQVTDALPTVDDANNQFAQEDLIWDEEW